MTADEMFEALCDVVEYLRNQAYTPWGITVLQDQLLHQAERVLDEESARLVANFPQTEPAGRNGSSA